MRKVINVFDKIICSIIVFLSSLFLIIESRSLLSGEWASFDFFLNGFLKHFSKVIVCLLYIILGIIELSNRLKNKEIIKTYLFTFEVGMIAVSVLIIIFTNLYLNLVVFIIILCFVLIKIFKKIYK